MVLSRSLHLRAYRHTFNVWLWHAHHLCKTMLRLQRRYYHSSIWRSIQWIERQRLFINSQCDWQSGYVTNQDIPEERRNHVSAVGKAIQTFKDRFISGLLSTYKQCRLKLREHLWTQATLTLNLLCTLRIDLAKSANTQLNGHTYNWNTYPLAPARNRRCDVRWFHNKNILETTWTERMVLRTIHGQLSMFASIFSLKQVQWGYRGHTNYSHSIA